MIVERGHDDYVLAVVAAGGDPKRAVVHVKQNLDDDGIAAVPAADARRTHAMEHGGHLTATQAKTVLGEMAPTGELDPAAIAARLGFEAMDTSELETLVDDAIAAKPDAWAKYCAGEEKALGAIVGHIMKASKGQADGKLVNRVADRPQGLGHRRSSAAASGATARGHATGGADRLRSCRSATSNRLRIIEIVQ